MKKIIRNLESSLDELRTLIETREDKIDDMSERWQESEKCEEWEDKTAELETQTDELETLIDELKQL